MKALNILMVVFFALSISLYGNSGIDGKQKKVKNKIGTYLNFPDFAKKENLKGTVMLNVSVNKTGKIDVNEIYGNPKFTDYVMGQIQKIKINPDKEIIGQDLLYKIIFN